jgi:protein-S-isoprenylcysteine O-methyltransferase
MQGASLFPMLRKLVTALFASLAFYVLIPAVTHPETLCLPQLWILVTVALLISAFQPAYKPIDDGAPPRDRGTASQIVWSVYLTQFVGIVEATFFRYPQSFRWDAVTTAALVGMVCGLGLRVWAVLTLGRYFTWFITVYDDHKVIRLGPFRFIRHPAYCGAWILFISTMLFLHAWVAAVVSLVAQLFAYVRRIRYEEQLMIEKLGVEYESYTREVKALVPLLW